MKNNVQVKWGEQWSVLSFSLADSHELQYIHHRETITVSPKWEIRALEAAGYCLSPVFSPVPLIMAYTSQ